MIDIKTAQKYMSQTQNDDTRKQAPFRSKAKHILARNN